MKECSRCRELKSLDMFYKRSGAMDGRRSECKNCDREDAKKQRINRPDNYRNWLKSNLGKVRERIHRWQINNPEKVREHNRRWRRAHPEKVNEFNNIRRSRKKNSLGIITADEWKRLKEQFSFTCLGCGRREPEIKLTLDHIKPLALGGENIAENAQPLCGSCNSKKGMKTIDYRNSYPLISS